MATPSTLLNGLVTGYNLLLLPPPMVDPTVPVLCGHLPSANVQGGGVIYYELTASARPKDRGYVCSQCLQDFFTALANGQRIGQDSGDRAETPGGSSDVALLRDLYHALRDPTDLYTLGAVMARAQQRLGE